MASQTTLIAGVFEEEPQARRALDALKQAGFDFDQIGIARQGKGSVDLKKDLLDFAMPREQATYYAQEFKAGRTVLSVRPEGHELEAHEIMHRYGGYDYEHRAVSPQPIADDEHRAVSPQPIADDEHRTVSPQPIADDEHRAVSPQPIADDEQRTAQRVMNNSDEDFYQPRSLKLREERLNPTKERVQSGEVTLHKEIITEQKTIVVPVTHEEVVVEWRAVADGRVDATPIGEGETIRIPVNEEQITVTKNTVVTGEVALGKHTLQETQQVTDTVRREEAHIEREGDVKVQGTLDKQDVLKKTGKAKRSR